MMRIVLVLCLICGLSFGQNVEGRSVGIQHAPFDLSGFAIMLIGEEDLALLVPGTEMLFSQRMAGNLIIIGSAAYTRSGTDYERKGDYDYIEKYSIQMIDVKGGVKVVQGQRAPKQATSFLYGMAGKRIASVKEEYEVDGHSEDPDEDYLKYQSARMSPYILCAGLGAEYFFTGSLSLSLTLHADMYYTTDSYEDEYGYDRTFKTALFQTRPLIGLHIYF